jgi:Protein of unknown function (DUF1292)
MPSSQNGNSGVEEAPVIFTTDEEGVEHRFQMIDMIEVDGQTYGLLLYLGNEGEETPAVEDGYDEEVVVMRIIEEDGEQVFEAIEDEDEFEKVIAYVESMEEEDEEAEELEEEENN